MNQQQLDKEDAEFRKRHPEIKFEDVGPTKGQFYARLLSMVAIGTAFMRWLSIKIFRRK